MYKQICFRFWAWFYAYKQVYSAVWNFDGKNQRVYINWRDLWCIAMMETAKMTTDAFTKYNNPFNFTEGSWMDGMLAGTYKGESEKMAHFKSMRLGVKAYFMWMKRNGFFDLTPVTSYAMQTGSRWNYHPLIVLTEFMSLKGFYTADRDTYYQAAAQYVNDAKKLSSPRTWTIAFAVVMALLIAYGIHLAVQRKKKKAARSRLRKMKQSKMSTSWKAA